MKEENASPDEYVQILWDRIRDLEKALKPFQELEDWLVKNEFIGHIADVSCMDKTMCIKMAVLWNGAITHHVTEDGCSLAEAVNRAVAKIRRQQKGE